jgi:hypothetical protein
MNEQSKAASSTLQERLDRQRQALRQTAGAWKLDDHPELAEGAAAWVHKIRTEDERFERERP